MSRILMVDDNPDIAEFTGKILAKDGHEMIKAKNGTECFEILKNIKPDLILLDVMMPEIDGWEVCKKIKTDEETKDIPVVMYTVRSTEKDMKKSYEYADGHINKPFKSEHLLKVVNSFLKV